MTERIVGIVGLGLMGGSLARGLKESSSPPGIHASSLDRTDLDAALADGIIDRAFDDASGVVREADVLVYATPLDATLALMEEHRDVIPAATVVTDVVSLKAPVARKARELGLADRWVGGHPMAGSERSGFDASRSDLFRDAPVFLVRCGARHEAVESVEALWTAVGAQIRWMDPEEHDRLMIWASHLPQLVSNALAASLARAGVTTDDLGPGGRDMTRLAASAPDLWKGLLESGGARETEALSAVIEELESLADLLATGGSERIETYMEATRRWRKGES